MATRSVLTPFAAEYPTTNFPQLQQVNLRPVLSFDAATSESCWWTHKAPVGLTGTLTCHITYMMASATTGGVVFDVSIEAVTPGDATDLDAGDSFDAANENADITVPATAGYQQEITITLTNKDGIVAGDYYRIKIARDVANANDDATGDCHVTLVEVRDAA